MEQPWNKIVPRSGDGADGHHGHGDADHGAESLCGDPPSDPRPQQEAGGAATLRHGQDVGVEPGVAERRWIIALHTSSIAIEAMAVESHEEKPDWDSWPSIVRWAAQLDPESPPAQIIARGAPIGPPLGTDIEPDDVRLGAMTAPPAGEPLTVVSGYLDDRRQFVGPGHRLYASATYAYAHRDFWTDREHRAYWRAHLHLWPARKGRRQDRESLAFAVMSAKSMGVPLETFLSSIGYSRDDLRDRHVLDMADRMRDELEAGPSDVRVPIVVTDEELDRMPLLTAHQTLDAAEGGANVQVGALAQDVVLRGAAEAAAALRNSAS
jgi:hypothetical protein